MEYSTQFVSFLQVIAGAGMQWLRAQPWFRDWHQWGTIALLGVLGFLFTVNPSDLPKPADDVFGWREPLAFVLVGLITSMSTVAGGTFAANWLAQKGAVAPRWNSK